MEDEKYAAERYLTVKGKTTLSDSMEEYIDVTIDLRTLPIRPSLNQEEVEQRHAKAKEDLENKIQALKIALV